MSEVKSAVEPGQEVQKPGPVARVAGRSWPRLLLSEPVVLSGIAVAFLIWAMSANSALIFQLIEVLIAVLFAVAVSYVMGMSGVPAFGNQLFYAGAAYLVAIMTTRWNVVDVLELCGASILFGLVLGGLMSLLLKRVTGVAFGMVTLAISQIAYVYVGISNYLGSDNGLSGISAGTIFGVSLVRRPTCWCSSGWSWCLASSWSRS